MCTLCLTVNPLRKKLRRKEVGPGSEEEYYALYTYIHLVLEEALERQRRNIIDMTRPDSV